jgi:hypothetical protein
MNKEAHVEPAGMVMPPFLPAAPSGLDPYRRRGRKRQSSVLMALGSAPPASR